MTRRIGCLTLLIFVFFGAPAFAATEDWQSLRMLEQDALAEIGAQGSAALAARRVRAQLVLADRALNQSSEDAQAWLELASEQVQPDTDSAMIAALIRCQLDHRLNRAEAEQSCALLAQPAPRQFSDFVLAYFFATQGYYHYRLGAHDLSRDAANAAIQVAGRIGDHALLAAAHNMIGLYFSTRLRPRMALPHLETAWEHSKALSSPEFKVVVQSNLASVYTYLGRASEALALLTEVQKTPVNQLYATRRIVMASMIAHAQIQLGRDEAVRAEQALLDAIARDEAEVLPDARTFAYTSLGLSQLALDRPDDALRSFDRVLQEAGQNFADGLNHPRIQLVVVPYARALRMAGETDRSIALLRSVIASVPKDDPDQLLVDAYQALGAALVVAGDTRGADRARAQSGVIQQRLWDASFRYRIATLSGKLEADRRQQELLRAQERETQLQQSMARDTKLRWQSWIIAAMLVALVLVLQSQRLQKRVAETERRANERLEQQVHERTRALEDEMAERLRAEVERRELLDQLAEADKMRVFGQLSAGVAHDFNNLMTVVTLAAEAMRAPASTPHTAQASEMLDSILAAADSGKRITADLLAYARKQPLEPVTLGLDDFIRETVPLLRNTVGETIDIVLELDPCAVRVDKGQLATALLNLVLNAKEAMPQGGRLLIRVKSSGEQAVVQVCDSGVGMAQPLQERATEPFFTTKTLGEGTGLGLSMVYGFARQSGGDLAIESSEGDGTTVSITLPLVPFPAAESEPIEHPQPVPGHLIRALVVEDREELRCMLERTLAQAGYLVSSACSGADAIEVVNREGMPDLLITDIVMPGPLNGYALARRLQERDSDLAVVLMSGYSDAPHGDFAFLQKPFSMSELESSIADALRHDEPLPTS